MAEAITTTKRYAVVTGSNKGIGFEICRQLAAKGIIVVLTARDEKKGFEALEKLKSDGLSDHVVFCQLDVVDPSSVASLADFIKSKFGSLDILVNNAGIVGFKMDWDSLQSSEGSWEEKLSSWKKVTTETYELGNECLQTNYYGTKRMVEALIPLLQLSDSPRIVNVSSVKGKLELISSEWAKGVLNDVESLTKERVEEVLNEFLKDFKEGAFETKGWPTSPSAYTVSKAAVNAYTRFLAKKYPTFRINCVCPGWVKTDINNHTGDLTTEQGAQCPVKLALLPDDGPSGLFFTHNEPSSFV
ncbi:(+)-neomenthol dehydrogenase-like [Camellia sinensis]|uniref:(+)-neomenthol dehydrogenase-like n=1 Tax=Camellia sinensis TaxID=4442 RepID=UPI00103609DF|nr:(+)-neomenthol dehydrogenase-like [Camellia sinensis]